VSVSHNLHAAQPQIQNVLVTRHSQDQDHFEVNFRTLSAAEIILK